MATTF